MKGVTPGGIDCDVHPAVPGMAALLPYLDDYWREQVVTRGIDGLGLASFPPGIAANGRADWRPPKGLPGGDLEMLRAQALGAFGTKAAICNPLYGVQALHNPHFATALARAMNDWMAAEWLDREPRLRASIVIAPQDPEQAVAEIDRRASDRRFVQVLLLAMGETLLGKRVHWPIYAAAERHGLPIGIHAGSTAHHATTGNGWPSYYIEDYAAQAQAFQAQLLSLVHEGVFVKYPGLTVVLIESGFTWLPGFMWRANKTWRGVRAEVPWVDRPPAELIRDHVRVTLQPTDAPPDAASLEKVIDQIGSDRMLLFSTDYPHWHFEGMKAFPAGFPAGLKQRVLVDNPLATYPRLKETLQ
ncbi:amidohydrolase family protein [Limobrevibacterium gyesilva]|uniref:Amidohydrolase n=1 Tax=Limobrevibacterium gyesilva TaxID=2991712 RepID=A0AA42CI66_9PROT|nr:amidohydrolase family protein [Limobrevibacterium gyesilva]MCW3475637.1 amidohydrolase [Limobrevibacterium gyesilva]